MLLLRGATTFASPQSYLHRFQYMLLLRGATGTAWKAEMYKVLFQYMLLLRGATIACIRNISRTKCFNTCSSCEEQRRPRTAQALYASFNTCSSCEEQLSFLFAFCSSICFNTCSSCEEQHLLFQPQLLFQLFQYMLLLRGATETEAMLGYRVDVSIHAPLARSNNTQSMERADGTRFQYMLLLRGATDIRLVPDQNQVSIHAPLARSNIAR